MSIPSPAAPDFGAPVTVATWSTLAPRTPTHALVDDVDLVVVRLPRPEGDAVSVLYGRCLHRGALLADGHIDGRNLVCGLHGWDYRLDTGVSEYNPAEALHRFRARIDVEHDRVEIDRTEVAEFVTSHPQPWDRERYLGLYDDTHGAPEEPWVKHIQELARNGLTRVGQHGPVSAMGVARQVLPSWDDIQILTAQLATRPLLDDAPVATELVIGPRAARPLVLKIPIFVSDMSFGSLSEEAKVALATGAELAGTGIASGEGGMLPEEQAANSRYFYEYASARFGFSWDKVARVQAFHFKGGQGAKTGTGGHLPGKKVSARIAAVRGLAVGEPAISPATFVDLQTLEDFRDMARRVRELTGGIPIGFKLSAQHIEADIDFALAAGADYVILDGRGGGTGAAPDLFKNHISVPLMAALPRARRHLERRGQSDAVTLIATGGLRTEADFVKALALGADGIAVANSALQAIGCLGMRACHTNKCPVGIATQDPKLRARLDVIRSARQLERWFAATVALMQVMARACGHSRLADFAATDLTTWKRDTAELTGVAYAGVGMANVS